MKLHTHTPPPPPTPKMKCEAAHSYTPTTTHVQDVMLEGMMLEIITQQQNFLNELNEKYKAKKYQVKRLKKQLKLKSVRDSLKNGPCKEYCPHCGKLLTNWYNYREHVQTHK